MWQNQISKPNLLAMRAVTIVPKQNESVLEMYFDKKYYETLTKTNKEALDPFHVWIKGIQ